MPFITAGDPDLDATRALILEMERRGADIIELGIPFSDPIADGPTIQSSFTRALTGGTTARAAMTMVEQVRQDSRIPIAAMVSYSIVGKIGVSAFARLAADAGIDGMIVPDLPVEEAGGLIREARPLGLCTIFLAAPTTTPERARLIVKHSTGFIYYISVAGTTGARATLPSNMRDKIAALKALTNKPVALGFGVSTPEQAAVVGKVADGVIVGSAIMKKVAECGNLSRKELLRRVGDLTESLARGTKGK